MLSCFAGELSTFTGCSSLYSPSLRSKRSFLTASGTEPIEARRCDFAPRFSFSAELAADGGFGWFWAMAVTGPSSVIATTKKLCSDLGLICFLLRDKFPQDEQKQNAKKNENGKINGRRENSYSRRHYQGPQAP